MQARDATRVEMALAYDPSLLQGTDVTAGSLLTLDGANVGVERGLEPGRVRVTFNRLTGVSGSGVVASVALRGLRPGTASLAVESLTVTTASGVARPAPPAPARIVVLP
jgi:hypothetical protein